jgi:hypothetical protein
MSWFKKLWQNVRGVEDKTVRARDEDGKFVADDKSTPDVDEAYTTVEVKKKKGKSKKKK